MMKKILLILLSFIMLGGATLGWRVWLGYESLHKSIEVKAPIILNIEPGDHLKKLSEEWQQLSLIQDAQALYVYGRYFDLARKIKVGEFELHGTYTPIALLKKLTTNQVKEYSVTFPEGFTFKQMLASLQSQAKIEVTLHGTDEQKRSELMAYLDLPVDHPEGLFFPSTYHYAAGIKDRDLLKIAAMKMQELLTSEWQARQPNLPYQSEYEALIMASIIEKETGVVEEREQIAGVFVRRLKKGMRLQTDPTIIYGLGDTYTGNLTRAHLKDTANPYNSYWISGLPPTPIAMPGRGAIHAALNPAKGDALYFVAKGDGSHQFSATLQAHNAAVKRYQLQRVKGYRSSK